AEQAKHTSIREGAGTFGDPRHLIEQTNLVVLRLRRGGQRRGLELGILLPLQGLGVQLRAIVVAADTAAEKVEQARASCRLGGLLLALALDGAAMNPQRPGERLDRGKQALLQPRDEQRSGGLLAFRLPLQPVLPEPA